MVRVAVNIVIFIEDEFTVIFPTHGVTCCRRQSGAALLVRRSLPVIQQCIWKPLSSVSPAVVRCACLQMMLQHPQVRHIGWRAYHAALRTTGRTPMGRSRQFVAKPRHCRSRGTEDCLATRSERAQLLAAAHRT